MADEQKPKIEHKLLLQLLFQRDWHPEIPIWMPFLGKRRPVRGSPLRYGLHIENIGDNAFPGCRVHDFIVRYQGGTTYHGEKSFAVATMNPGESKTYWMHAMRLHLDGAAWVKCTLEPSTPDYQIKAFQKGARTPESCPGPPNEWADGLYIEEKFAVNQQWTNGLIALLTLFIFLDGVWGLDTIVGGTFQSIGRFLSWLAGVFLSVSESG